MSFYDDGYMYDVNFPHLGLGEAISFLFQRILAFLSVGGGLFQFFSSNLGVFGGSSALKQRLHWLRSVRTTNNGIWIIDKDKRCKMVFKLEGCESQE